MRVSRQYEETMDRDMLTMADNTRLDTYDRVITEDERIAYGEEVITISQKVEKDKDEKKEMAKMLGDQIKDGEDRRRDILKMLAKGAVPTDTTIYTFMDPENYRVHEYNSLGERIITRKMKASERQLTIKAE